MPAEIIDDQTHELDLAGVNTAVIPHRTPWNYVLLEPSSLLSSRAGEEFIEFTGEGVGRRPSERFADHHRPASPAQTHDPDSFRRAPVGTRFGVFDFDGEPAASRI